MVACLALPLRTSSTRPGQPIAPAGSAGETRPRRPQSTRVTSGTTSLKHLKPFCTNQSVSRKIFSLFCIAARTLSGTHSCPGMRINSS
eukprot:5607577-Prymnesium_polylepis.1